MSNPLERQSNDLALIRIRPADATDLRVPLAEEETLDSQVLVHLVARSRLRRGWTQFPSLVFTQTRKLNIGEGKLVLPFYPGELNLATTIVLPALVNNTGTIRQNDWISVVAFGAEVGASQQPILGQLNFSGRYPGTTELVPVTKENSRRLRIFWLLVISADPLSTEAFLNAMPSLGEQRQFVVNDTSELGFALGNFRVYARDPKLTQHTYPIFSDMVQAIELCQVRRWQKYLERGYVHGNDGEGALNALFHITNTAPKYATPDSETEMRLRLRQIFSGKPGPGTTYNRTVQNLVASSVGSNPGFPGEAAGSPNGSVCLANDQRISFTNQAIIEKLGVQVVTAANNGSGSPVVSATLNSSPAGTFFSANRTDYRIYSANGLEQSDRGSFTNLGGTGSLIWVGDANTTIQPGQTVYFSTAIAYPGGSGFSVPFERFEQAWLNNTLLSSANLRAADSHDLDAYADPINNEEFFIVYGKERSALHYLLKRVTVTTDATGVAVIPPGERGCFAFIQGVAGRIDEPVKAGLTPNTTHKALVYRPPLSNEVWQFLQLYSEYQGTGTIEPTFLSGAVIVSKPLFYIHTQGGGSSVFQGDADTRMSPIAMHLPQINSLSVPSYRFNARVQVMGEPRQGPVTLREYSLLPAPGLALPAPGQVLSLLAATQNQSRSLKAKLTVDGQLLGFRTPALVGKAEFQAVLAFIAEKGSDRRLVILTRNTIGNENVAADSDLNTAIDTFRL